MNACQGNAGGEHDGSRFFIALGFGGGFEDIDDFVTVPLGEALQDIGKDCHESSGAGLEFGEGFFVHDEIEEERNECRNVQEGFNLMLDSGDGGLEDGGILRKPGFDAEGESPGDKVFRNEGGDMLLVDPGAFGDVEFGGGAVDGFEGEAVDELGG